MTAGSHRCKLLHMSKTKYGPPWTPEAVAAEAKRYKTRTEFQQKAYGAYEAALRRYGNLDAICAHMVSGRKLNRQWTREKIEELAKGCENLSEFRQKHRLAYRAVSKNDWHDLVANLPRASKPKGWWTLPRVSKEAAKYQTRTAFMKDSGAAYTAAHRNGWLDDVCGHMQSSQKPMRYWTREQVLKEAKKYSSRTDFLTSSAGAYAAATRSDYLDEACAHMQKKGSQYERAIYAFEFEDNSVYVGLTFDYDVRLKEHRTQNKHVGNKLKKVPAKYVRFNKWMALEEAGKEEAEVIESYRNRGWKILNRMKAGGVGSRPKKWSYEEIKKLAARYDTVKEFTIANPSAYTIALKHRWWNEISQHMVRAVEHGKWTLEALTSEAHKYSSRVDFKKNNPGAYSAAHKKGWLDLVCQHMEYLVNPNDYWTKERVLAEAQKYRIRVVFQKDSTAAYQKAWKEGWLEEVCKHMNEIKKPTGYWTLETTREEAWKYTNRVEFSKANPSAYNRARINGWLDEICEHMEQQRKPTGYWTREIVLNEASKFRTLKEFNQSAGGAPDAARALDLLPEIRQILKASKKPNNYWTLERVTEEAAKYQTRTEFLRGAAGAYGAARKHGWMDDVCAHMS